MIIWYIVDSFEILQLFYEHWTCLLKNKLLTWRNGYISNFFTLMRNT
jgi:hypothetical protein